MEDPQFLNLFWELSSDKPDRIAAAVPKVIAASLEGGEATETEFGAITESLHYTLKRLIKGLASSRRVVKLGFCTCLTALLRQVKLSTAKVVTYYENFDQSLHGKQDFFTGLILLTSCLIEADYTVTEALIETLIGYFKTKESLREAISNVLAKAPLTRAHLKRLAEANDIHYWRIKICTAKSSENLLVQFYKTKKTIVEGSYKSIPRCHSIWGPVIKAAKLEQAFEKLWGMFVEKELVSMQNHKDRGRHIGFSIALALKFLNEGVPVEVILTPEFVGAWHSNLCEKEHRHHENAVKLKKLAISKVTETAVGRLIELVQVTSVGDLLVSLAVEAIKTASQVTLTSALQSLKTLIDPRFSHFVGLMLEAISGKKDLEQDALSELFARAKSDDLARRKLLSKLVHSDLPAIVGIYEAWEAKPAAVWDKFKAENKGAVEKPTLGKRKAQQDSTITKSQQDALWKLLLLVTFETAFEEEVAVNDELVEVIDSLIHPKPKKRTAEEASTPIEELFEILLSLLNKQANYRRELVKSTFKEFASEVPLGLVETLCSAVISGEGFTMEEVTEEIMGEEVDITAEEAEAMLTKSVPSKAQLEELRTNYRLRACDLMEVLVKRSESAEILLKIYTALFASIQNSKQSSLKNRLLALLGKISKSKLTLSQGSIESAVGLLTSSVKIAASQNLGPIKPCVLSLAKAVAEVDLESARGAYNELLRLYIEKHTRKEAYSMLTQLLSSLPALADDSLVKKLVKYSKEAKQTHSQLQALALVKLVLSKYSSEKTSKSLKLAIKSKLKKGTTLPSKDWVKKALNVLQISCKKSGYRDGLDRTLSKLERKFASAVSVKTLIEQVKKTLGLS
mmetsp:Transcript_12840/g.23895  ORF Transcript_12840/g.23895 Transcript_12840/m.23895 type:complete len:853 (-) Transcript_12840:25-2583(-)